MKIRSFYFHDFHIAPSVFFLSRSFRGKKGGKSPVIGTSKKKKERKEKNPRIHNKLGEQNLSKVGISTAEMDTEAQSTLPPPYFHVPRAP